MLHTSRPAVFGGQDENASTSFEVRGNKENPGSVLGGKGAAGVKQPLVAARKALGNITNTTAKQAPGAAEPGKTVRKALGDISNSVAKKDGQLKEALKPPAAAPVVQTAAAPKSKAEIFAEDGVEKLAGKGWDELERERELREQAEIKQRVRMSAAALAQAWPSSYLAAADEVRTWGG